MPMNPEVKAAWVAALRSGAYLQTRQRLRRSMTGGRSGFCCLGVLCNLHAQAHPKFAATQRDWHTYDGSASSVGPRVAAWANLPDGAVSFLIHLNDAARKSFAQIADHVEANL